MGKITLDTKLEEFAQEYISDYNIVSAGARAGLSDEKAFAIAKTAKFKNLVKELEDFQEPDEITDLTDLLVELKRAMKKTDNMSDKIRAAKAIATLAQLVPEKKVERPVQPIINIFPAPPRELDETKNVTVDAELIVAPSTVGSSQLSG